MPTPLSFDLAERRVEVDIEDEPWRSHVAAALHPARVEPGAAAAVSVQVLRSQDEYEIRVDGERADRVPVAFLVTSVERTIIHRLMSLRPDLLWLHAGAARREDGLLVVLAGSGGQGKSTLTIGLVERGWRYLSDDTVPVVASTLEALSFPRTPGARVRRSGEAHRSMDDLAKQTFELEEAQVQRDPQPLSHVVFPCFEPGRGTDLRRLSKSGAAAALLSHCRQARADRRRKVAVVARIARELPAYELHYGSAGDALRLIEQLETGDRRGAD